MNKMVDKKPKLTGEHFYKFFQCPHWIWYDIYADQTKKGGIPPLIEMIHRGGLKHEKEMIQTRKFEEIKPELFRDLDEAFLSTLELMKQGKNIYHGVLMDQNWVGIPDLLEARPVEKGMKSNFGDHYYVVYDVKTGKEMRDEYKFQLVFYSLILERLQGVLPRDAFIVNSDGEERSFMVDDFLDYFHLTRERIERVLAGEKPPPFLKSGCKQSPWYSLCVDETKGCDDVSLIYRLSQNDQRRFYELGIHSVKDLASADLDNLRSRLEDWPFDKILRFYNQAQVLVSNEPKVLKKSEFPQVENEIYFDIESDPTEGIDYLFGMLIKSGNKKPEYKYFLAQDKKDEERVWRDFLDFLESLNDFVIYHYSYYEREVFKRLGNEYGISVALEDKFKNNTIDLHWKFIEAAVLPIYFYSLKDVAKYLGFKWQADDAGGAESVVWYNDWLQKHDQKIMDKIIKYNEDDVKATLFLKEWLDKQKPRTSKERLPED
ncbi:MAG: TM0106 family RecB-like putative nuclease [Candidatus Yanofskybacteria bacterium]|nr:TM0106 family RecB-like putative nuclease [Candidatus Yanofskybacteria bacterium]